MLGAVTHGGVSSGTCKNCGTVKVFAGVWDEASQQAARYGQNYQTLRGAALASVLAKA